MKSKVLYILIVFFAFKQYANAQTTTLQVKAFIEGLYAGNGKMISAPNASNPLITSQIADSVNFELHAVNPTNSNPFYASTYSSRSFIDTNGIATLTLPSNAIGNSYYLVLKHRNSIETWSSVPILINLSPNYYDFSTSSNKAYGNNLKRVDIGIFAIYSGDINQDGSVDFNDYPFLDVGSNNGDLGYFSTDINGDASVDFNDYPMLDANSNLGVIANTPPLVLTIGDSYAGGIVAFILQVGDPGYVPGVTHGIIAAPYDQGLATWGCYGNDIPTSSAIGSGMSNTIAIANGCGMSNIAGKICNDLILNGYNDWYLPSMDELNKLHLNRNIIGGFVNSTYWTSTQTSPNNAFYQGFYANGLTFNFNYFKTDNAYIRAIRYF